MLDLKNNGVRSQHLTERLNFLLQITGFKINLKSIIQRWDENEGIAITLLDRLISDT